MNRKCKQCQEIKALTKDNFYQDSNRKGGFQYTCKICKNNRYKETRHLWAEAQRVKANKVYIREVLELNPCQYCGESDVCCLDFHHVDSNEKDDTISRMVIRGAKLERLIAELNKCCVLCSNDHRRYHANRISFTPQKLILPTKKGHSNTVTL